MAVAINDILGKKLRHRELTEELNKLFDLAKEDRAPYERQWWLNIAFYEGYQWARWDEFQKRLVPPKRVVDWRVRKVVNMIRGTVRTEYAKLLQQSNNLRTKPMSDDVDDIEQAKACDDLLEYLHHADGSEGAEKRALLWALLTGTGILQAYWNKSHGDILYEPDVIVDPNSGMLTRNPKAGELVLAKGEPVHIGEIEATECSPFEFYPDPFGVTIKDKAWAFTVKLRSPEWIEEQYGQTIEPQTVPPTDYFEGRMSELIGSSAKSRSGVLTKTFWRRQSKKYHKGQYIVYADERVIWEGNETPYPKTPIPYSSFVHIPVAGRLWGESVITDLIDPQRDLNKTDSQAVEHRNQLTRAKYAYPKGALDVGKAITSAPAENIEYNAVPGAYQGGMPQVIPAIPVPDSYYKHADHARDQIRDVSGVNEVSMSGLPGDQRLSGIGIQALQEQDDSRLLPTSMTYEEAIAEIGKIKLELARQFYDETRVLRLLGRGNRVRVREFKKEDIPSDVDVRVEVGSALPKSRAARQQYIFALKSNGILTDNPTLLRMLEFGNIEGMFELIEVDITHAERENELMKKGTPVLAEIFHMHGIHMQRHDLWRKSEEYFDAPEEVKQIFRDHDALHKQLRLQNLMEQPETMLALGAGQMPPPGGNTPPGKPGTSAPEADPAAGGVEGQGGQGQAPPAQPPAEEAPPQLAY